ncbi:MAG: flagellar hook-associated protein FlgK [Desulfitobacteriaceae bacterium]
MPSTFFGLEISRRALQAQQIALNTTGHNISNASTLGYSRQNANLQATTPWSTFDNGHNISLGTGVSVENITRARDAFIDRQLRWETSKQQYWAGRQDALQKIEGIVNEPSDNSLHADMDNFLTAWGDLSKNPENMGARAVVRERALTLTDSFHNLGQQISDLQKDQDTSVRVKIKQINDNTQQIKELNMQIKNAEVSGDSPNDLRDKRDSLVDDLANLVSVRVIETRDPAFTDRQVNNYSIVIGSDSVSPPQVLIDNSRVNLLEEPAPAGPGGKPFATVKWAADADAALAGNPLDFGEKMGSLQASLEIRDTYLPTFGGQFDALAQGIATAVNALHKTGQGLTVSSGIDFFTLPDGSSPSTASPVTAANITLNSVIGGDLGMIATGLNTDAAGNPLTDTAVGDGSVAIAISSLSGGWSALQTQIQAGMFDPTGGGASTNPVPASSFGDYYGANVAQMGVDVQQATRMKDGQDVLVTQISNQQQSFSGVSLDEEMTNLVKFQKSYAAAARMVTMMDDMLDTIVNRMGTTR